MSFLHPALLWGALLAAVPLLVHLFDRRRPKPHPFPALAFVLRSQKRTASRLKLRRLLLYTARTLLLLAVPFALARPLLQRGEALAATTGTLAATAVVVDASFSMRYGAPASHFARALKEARSVLNGLRSEEPATLLLCSHGAPPPDAPAFDRRRQLGQLDQAEATYLPADLNQCLTAAARALEESPLPGKRIVLVSDLAAHGLRTDVPLPTVKGPDGKPTRPELWLRDVAANEGALANHAATGLETEGAAAAGPMAFQLALTVRNFSGEPVQDLPLELRAGGATLARGLVEVPARGSARKLLTHRFETPGTIVGELALAGDALADDDRAPFVLHVRGSQRVLVVNGAPSAVRYRDEAFFVEAALRAPGAAMQLVMRDAEAGLREDFSQYALVLLLNVAAPGEETATRLLRFVEAGGGLLISVGDRVDPDAYNAQLGSLLPRRLRAVRTAAEPDEEDADARAVGISELDEGHPALLPFTGPASEGLRSARFYRYVQVEPSPDGAGAEEILATLPDGTPALLVARRGKGRVALFTSTFDRDWSDFAIRTSFLPLLQRLSAYLVGGLEERTDVKHHVGDRVALRPLAGESPVAVASPSGEVLPLATQGDELITPPLQEPGVYQVRDAHGASLARLHFAVWLDPHESDLARVDPDALEKRWGAAVQTAGARTARREVPVWTWLLVAGALLLVAEGMLLASDPPAKRAAGSAP